MKIYFFANGNTAVFDDNEKQVSEYQKPWILTWIEEVGIDIDDIESVTMPNGSHATLDHDGRNWSIE